MTTTFAGRPVNGDINYYGSDSKTQKPIQELVDLLDAVLGSSEVEAVRWRQYTPYFNDGEACEFRIYGADAKFVGIDEGGDDEDGWHEIYLSYPDGYWNTHDHHGRNGKAKPDDRDRYWRLYGADFQPGESLSQSANAFVQALESGEHYVALRQAFGDPAEVVANREGFDVEHYEHG